MESKLGVERLPSFDGWTRDIRANYGGTDRKDGLLGPDGLRYYVIGNVLLAMLLSEILIGIKVILVT